MYVCMCVCLYVCVFVCMCVCLYVHVCMYEVISILCQTNEKNMYVRVYVQFYLWVIPNQFNKSLEVTPPELDET